MKNFLFTLFISTSHLVIAQTHVNQVFILNEGYFDYTLNQSINPVTIGVYDPFSETYTTIDTIHGARFASDLILDDDYLYVAADNMLHKYDKHSYNLLFSQQINGIRNIAIWDDKILATIGDYDNINYQPIFFNSYFRIFNKSDLSYYLELDTIIGPKWATQNVIVDGNQAYVTVNNAFDFGNEKGAIGVVDLNTFSYINEIDLGPDGINPDNMIKEGHNLYTVNNKDWSGSSISRVNLLTNANQTINLANAPTGCGTSCLVDNKIHYQISGDTILYEWDINTLPNFGDVISGFNDNFYALSYDTINNILYTSSTDFFSYGFVNIYSQNNILLNSFSCGISPGKIVFDIVNMTTMIQDEYFDHQQNGLIYDLSGRVVNVYDNPTSIYISNRKNLIINE